MIKPLSHVIKQIYQYRIFHQLNVSTRPLQCSLAKVKYKYLLTNKTSNCAETLVNLRLKGLKLPPINFLIRMRKLGVISFEGAHLKTSLRGYIYF
jgi:hypothetical protein